MDLTQTPFKVGDRVRINNPDHADHDAVGTIVGVDDLSMPWPYDVLVDGDWTVDGDIRAANRFEACELIFVERAS